MKKINISLMALVGLAMVATSCSSDLADSNTAGKKQVTFTATQEIAGGQTRTEIDGNKINWVSSDVVTIWDGTNKTAGTVTPSSNQTNAAIDATVEGDANKYTAVYPNSVGQNCSYSGKDITALVIPASQTATVGSYDPSAAIMTAYLEDNKDGDALAFKNVCSFIKFTTTKAYTSIEVTAEQDIVGTFGVDASTGVATASAGTKTVTLAPASGSMAAGTYYICVAPNATAQKLTIKCNVNATTADTYTTGNTTLVRNSLYDLGNLGYSVTVTNPIINVTDLETGHNIATLTFANVKNATAITSTPASTIATLWSDAACTTTAATTVGADGKVYVKAVGAGSATVKVGTASATVEVKNFAAAVYTDADCGTAATGSESEVYLKITDDGAGITDDATVSKTMTGINSVSQVTGKAGVYKVTCATNYSAAKLKVVYTYSGVDFTLLNKE